MGTISRQHKDNVFCLLYQDRGRLLSLYNAVNDSNYTEEEELTVVTLEGAICMQMRNDAAFLIDSRLNLYEQQSTVNPNMPLRDLFYVADELRKLIPQERLYKKVVQKIPSPRFVVFYNGKEKCPSRSVLRLSDMYEKPDESPELELTVTVLNINAGYNDSMLAKCESLCGYMAFVEKVRKKQAAGMTVEHAVAEAAEDCIRENILAEFFTEHKKEVVEVGIYEYDAELHDKALLSDGYEIGHAEGLATGRAEGLAEGERRKLILQIFRKLRKSKTPEQIAEELDEDIDVVQSICSVAQRFAPEYDTDVIYKELTGVDTVTFT